MFPKYAPRQLYFVVITVHDFFLMNSHELTLKRF